MKIKEILIDIQYDTNSEQIKNLDDNDLMEIATGLSDELHEALKEESKYVFQLWQVWEDTGDEFLMGTYFKETRAVEEQIKLQSKESGDYQYVIRPEEVKE